MRSFDGQNKKWRAVCFTHVCSDSVSLSAFSRWTRSFAAVSICCISSSHFCSLWHSRGGRWNNLKCFFRWSRGQLSCYLQLFVLLQFVSLCCEAGNHHLQFAAKLEHLHQTTQREKNTIVWNLQHWNCSFSSTLSFIPRLFQLEVKLLSWLLVLNSREQKHTIVSNCHRTNKQWHSS